MNINVLIELLCQFGKFICLIGIAYCIAWCLYGKYQKGNKMKDGLYLVGVFILVALGYIFLLPIMIIASIMDCLRELLKTFLKLNLTYFVALKGITRKGK